MNYTQQIEMPHSPPPSGIGARNRITSRLLSGSLIMLFGSGLVSVVNFGYNVAVARMLGPVAFGHASAAVTLLMLASAATLSFQLVCAKFVARNEDPSARAAAYSALMRRAWRVGLLVSASLALSSGLVASYLSLPHWWLVTILAVSIAFYIPLGVKRGGLQGTCAFRRLTWNFILEASVKFVGALILVQLGYGVLGAVISISASVIVAYFLPPVTKELRATTVASEPASSREGMQAVVFFVGQVIINNIDILLVKHFFAADQAGLYAAVALVGRMVYLLSWSIISAMFPFSAGAKREEEMESVLWLPFALITAVATVFIASLSLFPQVALRFVFGAEFQAATHSVGPLLALYAAATGVYSLSVVLMAYEMSRRIANTGWLQLVLSGAVVVGIYRFHATLQETVMVQLVLMCVLLLSVSVPFLAHYRSSRAKHMMEVSKIQKLRRATEAEVIAEFLKAEFYQREFHHDREQFEQLVWDEDLSNEDNNARRRALLFRRRGHLWRELPRDTQWWEVQLAAEDLDRIRVFPRAQWRAVSRGSFLLKDIVAQIRSSRVARKNPIFINHLQSLSKLFAEGGRTSNTSVILIGSDEESLLTIIEGNHRLTAAVLASPEIAQSRFRVFCGLSKDMTQCCWYHTDLLNLSRYAKNRLKYLIYDKESDVHRVRPAVATAFAGPGMPPPQAVTESKSGIVLPLENQNENYQ